MLQKPSITAAPAVRVMINVGATMDIPTGWYVKGKYGENLLLGGLATVDSITGKGNNYKSTILHYRTLSAASRMCNGGNGTSITTYDTESNMHEDRLAMFSSRFDAFRGKDIFLDQTWIITDKTVCYANKWFDQLKDYLLYKRKNSKDIMVETPFLDRNHKDLIKIQMPTFSQVDSLSQVETDDTASITARTELGESDANHIYLRQGLAKKRLLDEYITEGPAATHYLLMTAHFGKDKAIGGGGGFNAPPPKTLNSLKPGEKPKGVPDNFFYLTHSLWLADGSTKLIHRDSKGPEYPKEGHDSEDGGVDLFSVPLTMLRCKSGPSEYTLRIVVSQTEGVLPSLTEFHALKENDRFGMDGTQQHYALDIYPSVKLSRTTVRTKIDSDPKLQRALNITCELMQIGQFYRNIRATLPTAKQLYDKITELGYDWDLILSKTRGWWTINNTNHPLYFLSTMDLVEMYHGNYHPYWLAEDKKTIKPEFEYKP